MSDHDRPIEVPVNDRRGRVIAFARVIEVSDKPDQALLQFVVVRPDGQESLKYSEVIRR
jgi:hypothetical protein